jgi:5'-deoxynucleotidase YfbR-like HD superfamily hydrolase
MDAAAVARPAREALEPGAAPALLPLFRELGHLKRLHSAGRRGSIASRLFRRSWTALLAGRPAKEVALATTAGALAAARLGDLDRYTLVSLGLSSDEAIAVQRRGLDEVSGVLDPSLAAALRSAAREMAADEGPVPAFVDALDAQPRAGITCPGRPRIVLQPPENHAEHCLTVAVYGVLLAPAYGADAPTVFLAGLAHHLHNAAMPDSGFTGEMLLGAHLEPVMQRATCTALDEIAEPLRSEVERARAILPDAGTPEGRAFHAADVLDRVLEIEQHLVAPSLTMDRVLGEMALVHDGPVKPFHDRVLAEMGLT